MENQSFINEPSAPKNPNSTLSFLLFTLIVIGLIGIAGIFVFSKIISSPKIESETLENILPTPTTIEVVPSVTEIPTQVSPTTEPSLIPTN